MRKNLLLALLLHHHIGLAQTPELIIPTGHQSAVRSVEFSPDNKFIITASSDKTAKLWNTESGNLIYTLADNPGWVQIARFSPDNKYIALASAWLLKIYGESTRDLLYSISKHTKDIIDIKFVEDRQLFLTASGDSAIDVRHLADGKLEYVFPKVSGPIKKMEISPDKKVLLSVFGSHIQAYDLKDYKPRFARMNSPYIIKDAKFSPDSKYIIAVSDFNMLVWRVADGQLVLHPFNGDFKFSNITFSKDGHYLMTASSRQVDIFTYPELVRVQSVLKEGPGYFLSAKFSPDGTTIAIRHPVGFHNNIDFWDFKKKIPLGTVADNGDLLSPFCFSEDGRYLVAGNNTKPVVWNVGAGRPESFLTGSAEYNVQGKISPDGKLYYSKSIFPKIWDISTNRLICHLNDKGITQTEFSNDSKNLLTISPVEGCKIWDCTTWKSLMVSEDKKIVSVIFSHGDRFILTASADSTFTLYDRASLKTLFSGKSGHIGVTRFSRDDASFILVSGDSVITRYSTATGKPINKIEWKGARINGADISPDDKYLICYSSNNLRKYALSGGHYIFSVKDTTLNRKFQDMGLTATIVFYTSICYSPDGKYILASSFNNAAYVYDAGTGELLHTLPHGNYVLEAVFSADSRYIITASGDNTASIWDAASGKELHPLTGHSSLVNSAAFTPDAKIAITSANDGTSKRWDVASGELICTFLGLNEDDYLVLLPDGYYTCTKGASRLLYFTNGTRKISFRQLDVRFNRPDRVAEKVGTVNPNIIRQLKQVYLTRVAMLSLDTIKFRMDYEVPDLQLNAENDKREHQNIARLHLIGNGKRQLITGLNIWVNDVPVFGAKGIGFKEGRQQLDTLIPVILGNGNNEIEAAVTNENGLESYRIPTLLKYNPSEVRGRRIYFLGIGAGKFRQPGHALYWCDKDISDLAALFRGRYKDTLFCKTIFDENVCQDSIAALKKILLGTDVNDIVILAFSGHGLFDNQYHYFLSGFNTNFESPEYGGIPYPQIEQLLDNIPARKKLFLLDACNGGGLDTAAAKRTTVVQGSGQDLESSLENAQKITDNEQREGTAGDQELFNLMQDLFADVSGNTGSIIISASRGNQLANAGRQWSNGAFTYAVKEGLEKKEADLNKDTFITISELKEFVSRKVAEITANRQRPTARSELLDVDWVLW